MLIETFKVSIIVPTYNGENYIRQTIDSIINQTYLKELLEIIIVNDGSTDGTSKIISEYSKYINVINTVNNGVSYARNIGIKAATGDYIQFLDSDDLIHPEKIELQILALLKSDVLPSFICSNWAKVTEDSSIDNLNQISVHRPFLSDLPIKLVASDNFIPLMSGLIKADVAKKINGFDTEMSHIEDVNFLIRLYMTNKHFLCFDYHHPLFYYRDVKASASKQNKEAFFYGIYKNSELLTKSFNMKRHELLLTNYWAIYLNSISNNYQNLSKLSSNNLKIYSINSSEDFKFKIFKILGHYIFSIFYKFFCTLKTK